MTTFSLDRLVSAFKSEPQLEAAAQSEREALVDLMVWTMYVDRHIAAPEQAEIERVVSELSWTDGRGVDAFINASMRRSRDVLGNAEAEARYLATIAAKLESDVSRRRAYDACACVAAIDGEVSPEEHEHLAKVAEALDITP